MTTIAVTVALAEYRSVYMKKRIISGVVMGIIVAAVLTVGLIFKNTKMPIFDIRIGVALITVFIAAIAAMATWELVSNALGLKWLPFRIVSAVYTAGMVFLFYLWLEISFRTKEFFSGAVSAIQLDQDELYMPVVIAIISIFYFVVMAVLSLVKQQELGLEKIISLCTMPLFISFSLASLGSIATATNGVYYLLLILNFSSVCDMGAYFVGVSIGKTKLCPEISPKKTVEGAFGGIISSIIVGVVITLCFEHFGKIFPVVLLAVPLCAAGMAGDLFASIIKRKVGIKDYGNLIPGHGGVLDRIDSILFIAPLMFSCMFMGII